MDRPTKAEAYAVGWRAALEDKNPSWPHDVYRAELMDGVTAGYAQRIRTKWMERKRGK